MSRLYRILFSAGLLLGLLCLPSPITRFASVIFAALCVYAAVMQLLLRLTQHANRIIRRIASTLYAFGIAAASMIVVTFAAVQLLLLRSAHTDPEAEHAQYLLVLGAGIREDRPSNTLRTRLEAARDCALRNPSSTIIVCGGQGDDEDYPEALVMKNWLVEHGVPAERIRMEDRSTNTIENIAFAKEILDRTAPAGYTTAVVSNGFHLFRARHLMAQAGLDPVAVSAPSPWHLRPVFCLREYCSLVILAATNRW